MRRRVVLLLLLVALDIAAAAGPWQSLFDGRTFAGWRSPSGQTAIAGAWRIEGGHLIVRPHVQHRTDLWTIEEFEDFEMEWQWRAAPGANSGVKYRVERVSTLVVVKEDEEWRRVADPAAAAPGDITIEYSHGFEYQMAAPDEPSALKFADARAGALYSLLAPQPDSAGRPAGQWNRSRLVVNGPHIEHWLNGRRVVDTTVEALTVLAAAKRPNFGVAHRRGPIALQYHQTEVAFRAIRIRRL